MRLSTPPPALLLLLASLVGVAAIGCALILATATPWLGLRLTAAGEGPGAQVIASNSGGPAARLNARALLSVGGVKVLPQDALDEPDYLPDYRATDAFFARQTRLHAALQTRPVHIVTLAADGRTISADLTTGRRPLSSLPADFWAQLVFGLGSFLVGAWVWSLRPRDLAAILFALSGVAMLAATVGAGVYTSRELALDGGLFRLLSAANHGGAMLFGFAMIGLFLIYPRRLASGRVIAGLGAAIFVWLCADLAHVVPAALWGASLGLVVQTALIAVAVAVQWRATRDDPVGRTALRWLGLLVVAGAAAAIPTAVIPQMLGRAAPLSQGYVFGFFFIIYVGLAAGLRRSRVFQLGEWSFRIAFYAGAGLLLALVDAALVLVLRAEAALSLGVSLLAIAFLYLPLREWVWRRLVARRRITDEELFDRIVDTALAARPDERREHWRSLLTRLFDPLQIEVDAAPSAQVRLLEDGLALAVPATGASPGLILRAPWAGRGLFGPAHLRLAQRAVSMVARTETGLSAYERGAAEERRRIAQDLHDDVNSLLLSGLHKADLANTRQVIRDALADVSMIAAQLSGQRSPLVNLIADMRHETRERLESAGVALDWPLGEDDDGAMLDLALYKSIRAAVRELVSNVIRHAQARHVRVEVERLTHEVRIVFADDGRGLGRGPRGDGMGLAGMGRRMQAVGGRFELPAVEQGLTAVLIFGVAP